MSRGPRPAAPLRAARRTVATLAVCCLAAACSVPEPAEPVQLVESAVPPGVAGEGRWQYQQRVAADLDGDGRLEVAVMIADVEIGTAGTPLWEHGHQWQVYVEDADGERTYVYARFLPNGTLEARLSWPQEDAPPTILLLERTPHSVGVYEIHYGGAGNVVASRLAERPLRRGLDFTESTDR